MYQGLGINQVFTPFNFGGVPIGLPMISNWLKEYGSFTTYSSGKWQLGLSLDNLLPEHRAFDHFFGFYGGGIGYTNFQVFGGADLNFNGDRFDLHEDGRDYDEITQLMQDDDELNVMYLYRDKILQWIQDEADNSDPFYMYLPMQSPRGPLS